MTRISQDFSPVIVYEDKDIVAVNKPAGLLVHHARISRVRMDDGRGEQTLSDYMAKRYPEILRVGDKPAERPGIVHRLDRGTSGVIILARNQEAFLYLKSLFQKREITKTYLAIVRGVPSDAAGRIEKPISVKSHSTKRTVGHGVMTKDAITNYRVIRSISSGTGDTENQNALLLVHPQTGRTHQIRVHLASIGHPVIGDTLYGKEQGRYGRLMLHALSLEFTGRDGARLKIEAEPPAEFEWNPP